jgi:hypothetical protein
VFATGASNPKTVTITNLSRSNSATLGAVTADSPFSISNDQCSGMMIAPRGKCTVALQFLPDATTRYSGALAVPYNGPTVSVPLSGVGAPVKLKASGKVKLGTVTAGSSGAPRTITVTNPSSVSVNTSNLVLNGPFVMMNDGCSGQPIPSNGMCTFQAEFAPPQGSSGKMTGSVVVPYSYGSNAGQTTINLSGKAN